MEGVMASVGVGLCILALGGGAEVFGGIVVVGGIGGA